MGIKVYNSLPPEIKDLSQNIKKFKSSLRGFLHQHSFYTLEDYFSYKAVVWYSLTTKLTFIIVSRTKFWGMFPHVRYILIYVKDDIIALYSLLTVSIY